MQLSKTTRTEKQGTCLVETILGFCWEVGIHLASTTTFMPCQPLSDVDRGPCVKKKERNDFNLRLSLLNIYKGS